MTEPLDLERIRAYIAKATAGPLAWQKFGENYCLTGQYGMRPIVLSASRHRGLVLRDPERDLLVPFSPDHPDAVFHAESRTDLPAAIDEIERLRAEWDWIEKHRPLIERQAIGQWRVCTVQGCYEADTLREAIAAARNEQECNL